MSTHNNYLTGKYAHTPSECTGQWHNLLSHIESVGEKTADFVEIIGVSELGKLVGLLHDIGKINPDFQEYLIQCNNAKINNKTPPRSNTPHSLYGAIIALNNENYILPVILEGHHGGMKDLSHLKPLINHPNQSQKTIIDDVENDAFVKNCITSYFSKTEFPKWTKNKLPCEFFIRMLFSALVDADWLDTENHFDHVTSAHRKHSVTIKELWDMFNKNQTALVTKLPASTVNDIRNQIYDACIKAADGPQNVYKLTVPTGGGKTRSSMAFALKHAIKHELKRIIVAIPYTSIIDQNVKVYKEIFGVENVLEHHSNIEISDNLNEDETEIEICRQLASENWDMPIIVTTTVQLFDSLFSNKPSRCRKLHNLAGSVIILDEVQTLPTHLLQPIIDILKELVDHYRVTLVMSTATQPAFGNNNKYFAGFNSLPIEILPNPTKHFNDLKRVEYDIIPDPWTWKRVAEELYSKNQSLCIVNTRKDAIALLDILDNDDSIFHLSTLLCPAHRKDILNEINRRLTNGETCHVVSTQVVEAGVDLDFPLVLRAIGPLDRIVQAAGRCNREGLLKGRLGRTVIFTPEVGGSPKGNYATAIAEASIALKNANIDLHSPDVFNDYFYRLWQNCNLDQKNIRKEREDFNFQKVAENFRMIDDYTIPIVVRYGDPGPVNLIYKASVSQTLTAMEWRELQQYIVNIYEWEYKNYQKNNMIIEIIKGLNVWEGVYDNKGITAGIIDPMDLIS